jgi:predicted ATP-grasp superfamily ATP-dependent carboligase
MTRDCVLLTDAEERSVLGACRALKRAGYQTSAVARSRPAATHWSRSCAERFLLPDPRDSVPAFVGRLEEVLRRKEYAAVIPGSEAALLAISKHRSRLECLTRLGLPPHEAVRRSVDKQWLLRLATEVGLPPPASASCVDAEAAALVAQELGFPVVLKPATSFLRSGEGLRQQGVCVVEDEAALVREVPLFGTPFIVQRFESDSFLFSCSGVVADGRLLALTTSRARRLWPPTAGMHAFAETVPVPDGLADRVRSLLAALGWRGIFQIQMLEMPGGRFSAIDLNPRLFASVSLDARAGANLAAVWCDWLLERRPTPVTARPGIRYRWEEGELCHLAWQLQRRRFRAAASVVLPHRRVEHAWFRLTDPGPLLARALSLGLRAIKSRFSREPTDPKKTAIVHAALSAPGQRPVVPNGNAFVDAESNDSNPRRSSRERA